MNKNFREFNKRAIRLAGIKESKRPINESDDLQNQIESFLKK